MAVDEMAYFNELDNYLSQSFSIDSWEDDASLHAIELTQRLTPDDWDVLESSWRNKMPQWQRYCASVIPWGDVSRAIPVLLEMVQTADDELTTIAADSLRDIHSNITPIQVNQSVKARLQEVAHNHPGITARVINDLLESL
jgi:hypothetical protein